VAYRAFVSIEASCLSSVIGKADENDIFIRFHLFQALSYIFCVNREEVPVPHRPALALPISNHVAWNRHSYTAKDCFLLLLGTPVRRDASLSFGPKGPERLPR